MGSFWGQKGVTLGSLFPHPFTLQNNTTSAKGGAYAKRQGNNPPPNYFSPSLPGPPRRSTPRALALTRRLPTLAHPAPLPKNPPIHPRRTPLPNRPPPRNRRLPNRPPDRLQLRGTQRPRSDSARPQPTPPPPPPPPTLPRRRH